MVKRAKIAVVGSVSNVATTRPPRYPLFQSYKEVCLLMPPIGFWAFVRLCVNTAWTATISYLNWNAKSVIIGAISLVLGLVLFAIARNKKDAQSKAWERFLLIVAPTGLVACLLFIFNLCRSPLLVYRAQQGTVQQAEARVKQVENEKKVIASDLEQEKDKSRPKFEIGWASPTVGEGYEIMHGHRGNFTDVYLQVSVLNHGAPSVINGCKGIAHLIDGTELEAIPYEPSAAYIHVHGPYGLDLLPTSPSLLKIWSITPIPTGGRGIGYVLFKFPSGTKKKFEGPGGKFIIKVWDISGKESQSEILWSNNPPKEILSLPGMAPMR